MADTKRNAVIERGRIVSIKEGKNGGRITIVTSRITTTRKDGKNVNVVRSDFPVFQYQNRENSPKLSEIFKVGDNVHAEGHLQSFRIMSNTDGETHDTVSIMLDNLAPLTTKMEAEFGVEGNYYVEQTNEVLLAAPVVSISKYNNTLDLRLDLSDGKRVNFVNIRYYNASEALMDQIVVGKKIYAICMVQTVDTTKEKVKHSYQTFVAQDIAVAE